MDEVGGGRRPARQIEGQRYTAFSHAGTRRKSALSLGPGAGGVSITRTKTSKRSESSVKRAGMSR